MVPASHLLSGFLAGRLLTLSAKGHDGNGLKNPVVLVAMAGSVVPDLDVLPGLLFGWNGAGLHRTATHSVLGSFVLALCLAGVTYAASGRRRFWLLYVAALIGVWTHIFWDMLNTWGVQLFWPWTHTVSGNLVHEGDFFILGTLATATGLSILGKRRWTLGIVVTLVPSCLLLNLVWRDQLRTLATEELAGRQVETFPTRIPWRPWIALSRRDLELEVHCLRTPFSSRLVRVKAVKIETGKFVERSLTLPLVRDFREAVWFPYAQTRRYPSGNVLVVWSDLRETFMEEDLTRFPGIHVVLDPTGDVVDARLHWHLPFW